MSPMPDERSVRIGFSILSAKLLTLFALRSRFLRKFDGFVPSDGNLLAFGSETVSAIRAKCARTSR
jgi:hypothetical protein